MVNILYWTDRLQAQDRLYVGEKAWQLGQLQRDHYPICRGFVISAELFRNFFEQLDDSISLLADFPASVLHLNGDDFRSLQWVAQQSRQALQKTPFPEDWREILTQAIAELGGQPLMVRASLALSPPVANPWTGLLSAQICSNQLTDLETSIKQIWSQVLGAKSLFYWQRQGIELNQLYLAILVQPIAPTLASGIAEIQGEQCELKAIWGLGYGFQSEEMQPERYTLDLAKAKILKRHRGNQLRGYGLTVVEANAGQDSPWRSQLLTTTQQNRYVLTPALIQRMIPLLQRLAHRSPTGKIAEDSAPEGSLVEWSLAIAEDEPTFYVHQWRSQPHRKPLSPALPAPANVHTPLITGLGASPGIVQAIAHVVTQGERELRSLPKDCILIAPQILPHWLPHLNELKGIVTEQGGVTSHAAILAREFGIPAIFMAENVTHCLKQGDWIRIDGQLGTVSKIDSAFLRSARSPVRDRPVPQEKIRLKTQLMVNLSQPQSLREAIALPLAGIGLLRSELMMIDLLASRPLAQWLLAERQQEFVQKLAAKIQEFAASFSPRPVFYRTYDEKGIAQSVELSYPSLLPQRGAYGYLLDARLFDLELQALRIVQTAGLTNLRLILPFVRTVEEIEFCVQRLQQWGLSDREQLPLWMMAEVPSVLFQLSQYVQAGIQGIAIGTNDLSQLLLGIDREASFSLFSQSTCPPALLSVLKQLVDLSHILEIPCSICGQATSQYPSLIPLLIDWGVTAISVEPSAVIDTYYAIAHAEQCLRITR